MYQLGGGVTTFGCSMYVELISCFHICSIIINYKSKQDLVHLFVREGDVQLTLTWLCGVFLET